MQREPIVVSTVLYFCIDVNYDNRADVDIAEFFLIQSDSYNNNNNNNIII